MTISAKQLRSKDYLNGCCGKIRYQTEAEALLAIRETDRRVLRFPDIEMVHYPCRYGKHWHIGHQEVKQPTETDIITSRNVIWQIHVVKQ